MNKLTVSNRVLKLLKARPKRGVTTNEFLNNNLYKFATRISDLRKKGYRIICEREDLGKYRYFLIK